jgi:hypothetical protein
MEIVSLTKDLYEDWDKFCVQSDDAWFWYTTKWIEFFLKLRPEFNSQQKSFMIKNNNDILAICPLILNKIFDEESEMKYYSFNLPNGNTPALINGLSFKQKNKILTNIFNYVDELAWELGVQKSRFTSSPLSPSFLSENQYNFLTKFGYLDTTLNTQILDLSLKHTKIFNEMRKGHRYDIRRGERTFDVKIFNKDNITKEIFDLYRTLHHKAANRVTRPLVTFEMMYHWIIDGHAILCGASFNSEYVSFALINIYKKGAYYSSACNDPDLELGIPASHIIQWNIIKWLKENGFRFYELGLQQFGTQLFDFPSEKDLSISFFKRGFGGFTIPFFSGERYYDKTFFEQVIKKRTSDFLANYCCEIKTKGIAKNEH